MPQVQGRDKSGRKLSAKQNQQRNELADQILKQRRLQSSWLSKQTREVRELGLTVARRERVTRKDLVSLPVKELRKLVKQTAKKPENTTVMLKNKQGVVVSLAQAQRYQKALKEHKQKVSEPIRRKMTPHIAEGNQLDPARDKYAIDQILQGYDLEDRTNRLNNLRSATDLAKETAKIEAQAKAGEQAVYERYQDSFIKAFDNAFTDVNPLLKHSARRLFESMPAEQLVQMYYRYGGIFDIGYLYNRAQQTQKLNMMLGILEKRGFQVPQTTLKAYRS